MTRHLTQRHPKGMERLLNMSLKTFKKYGKMTKHLAQRPTKGMERLLNMQFKDIEKVWKDD